MASAESAEQTHGANPNASASFRIPVAPPPESASPQSLSETTVSQFSAASSSSSSQLPAPGPAPAPRQRRKVPLGPGFSMLDWQRLPVRVASHGAQRISRAELARHCTADDCWMAIAGRVYDVTAYVPFHPGGRAELLRGAGGDATELVRSTHAWVSIDTFIGRCFIGMLEP